MDIMLNGERREALAGASLLDLINEMGLPRDSVVVERNGQIVNRGDFETTRHSGGDVIELVRFVGGG